MTARLQIDYAALEDLALARLVASRDIEAVRLLTVRNNQRLFRTAWSILKNRADAEDCVQSTYLSALANMSAFEGRSSLSTWLVRIVINDALGRARAARRRSRQLDATSVTVLDRYREKLMRGSMTGAAPDAEAARTQIRHLLEDAISDLPPTFRIVFVLREVEGLSVEETAQALGVIPATVKTRLLRARQRLRKALAPEVKTALAGSFPFAGADCEALTERVLQGVASCSEGSRRP